MADATEAAGAPPSSRSWCCRRCSPRAPAAPMTRSAAPRRRPAPTAPARSRTSTGPGLAAFPHLPRGRHLGPGRRHDPRWGLARPPTRRAASRWPPRSRAGRRGDAGRHPRGAPTASSTRRRSRTCSARWPTASATAREAGIEPTRARAARALLGRPPVCRGHPRPRASTPRRATTRSWHPTPSSGWPGPTTSATSRMPRRTSSRDDADRRRPGTPPTRCCSPPTAPRCRCCCCTATPTSWCRRSSAPTSRRPCAPGAHHVTLDVLPGVNHGEVYSGAGGGADRSPSG